MRDCHCNLLAVTQNDGDLDDDEDDGAQDDDDDDDDDVKHKSSAKRRKLATDKAWTPCACPPVLLDQS